MMVLFYVTILTGRYQNTFDIRMIKKMLSMYNLSLSLLSLYLSLSLYIYIYIYIYIYRTHTHTHTCGYTHKLDTDWESTCNQKESIIAYFLFTSNINNNLVT